MLSLIQIIKYSQAQGLFNKFKLLMTDLSMEYAEGMIDSVEWAETIESMIGAELSPVQLERLAEVLSNGSWKSAFNLAELK